MKGETRPILLAGVAVLSWSTVATAFKIALSRLSVFEMVLIASATALLIFTITMTVSRSWGELRGLPLRLWSRFALLGLISPVAYYMILFCAYDYLPAQVAQPINYVWPIMLTVLLAIVSRKRIPAAKYIGMAVSLGGVALISLRGGVEGEISALGVAMALGSALLWALYWIVNDSLKESVGEVTSLFLTFLFGTLYLVAVAVFVPVSVPSVPALLSGMYIGAFEMGIPFVCFGMAIRQTNNPALVNQMCYLAPFMSLFIISVVLGERIAPATYIGLLLIVAGLVYNQYFAGRGLRRTGAENC